MLICMSVHYSLVRLCVRSQRHSIVHFTVRKVGDWLDSVFGLDGVYCMCSATELRAPHFVGVVWELNVFGTSVCPA